MKKVSLEKCAQAVADKAIELSDKHDIDVVFRKVTNFDRQMARAALDAAGIAYE